MIRAIYTDLFLRNHRRQDFQTARFPLQINRESRYCDDSLLSKHLQIRRTPQKVDGLQGFPLNCKLNLIPLLFWSEHPDVHFLFLITEHMEHQFRVRDAFFHTSVRQLANQFIISDK